MGDTDIAAIGARLDRMPISPFHHKLALIIAAGLLVDSVDIYLMAGVSSALVREKIATLQDVGHIAMATALGVGVGGLVTGAIADRFGRLATLRWTILLVIAGAAGSAMAPSVEHLLVWRTVAALGLGGESVIAYGALIEFVPLAARGRWLAWVGLLASFALPLCLGLGYLVLPLPEGWRWMLAIPGAAAIIVAAVRLQLPESPRWLSSRGRIGEAEAIVAAVEATAPGPLPPPRLSTGAAAAQAGIFSAETGRRLIVGAAIHSASLCAVYGFVFWLPTFFVSSGHTIASSALFSGIMMLGAPVGTTIAFLVTDRVERKWAVVASALLAGSFGVAYAFAASSAAIVGLGFLVVVTIYAFATLGMMNYVPELFDTSVRLRALGIVSMAGRATAFAMPLLVVPVFTSWGQAGVVTMVSAALALQAGVVALLGARTKGRSLESV